MWFYIFIGLICIAFKIGMNKGLVYHELSSGKTILYSGSLSDQWKLIDCVKTDSSTIYISTKLMITEDAYYNSELDSQWSKEASEAIRYAQQHFGTSDDKMIDAINKRLEIGSKQLEVTYVKH